MIEPVVRANADEIVLALGLQPPLTNNAAESNNATLKRWIRGTAVPIDEAVEAIKLGAISQYEELQRGFLGLSQKIHLTSKINVRRKQMPLSQSVISDLMDAAEDSALVACDEPQPSLVTKTDAVTTDSEW